MVKHIGMIIIVLTLAGCNSTLPRVETVYVDVPVFQCPANHQQIKRPSRPILAVEALGKEDYKDPGKVAIAYNASIKQLTGYSSALEIGFDTYRNMCVKAK